MSEQNAFLTVPCIAYRPGSHGPVTVVADEIQLENKIEVMEKLLTNTGDLKAERNRLLSASGNTSHPYYSAPPPGTSG